MKTKETDPKELMKVPENSLLSLVISKVKGRVLFPEKLEEAKQYLQNATIIIP